MRVLVLGGTQFVGQAVAGELVARGWDVSILTRGILPSTVSGIGRWCRADRRDASGWGALAGERFDAVVDVSAYTAADVEPVLDALRFDDGARYVLVSSGAVYRPSDRPLAEDAPAGENVHWGPYGLGKLEAERLLLDRQSRCGYALSIVRPAYLYGPGNNLLREAYLFDRLEKRLPVPVPSGGTRTQFAIVDEAARMVASLAEPVCWSAEAFNCAHPEPVGWDDLVRAAARAVGVEPHIAHVRCSDALEARSFFPFRDCSYVLDVRKAAKFGLPSPRTALEEGMVRTYAWYRERRPILCDPKMTRIEEALRRSER